jgi:hypothetical protein
LKVRLVIIGCAIAAILLFVGLVAAHGGVQWLLIAIGIGVMALLNLLGLISRRNEGG